MPTEIEAKMKVDDLAVVRRRLQSKNAKPHGCVLETNTFFDTPKRSLLHADSGLRIRIAVSAGNKSHCTVTMKGPLQQHKLKSREEIEFAVDSPKAVEKLFQKLGYQPTLAFEKRRESWTWKNCKIELDELPYLGKFVEIEGPTEKQILSVRKSLGLSGLPLISRGYISMVADYAKKHRLRGNKLRF
jgi:adenylate cyclase, class 2